MVKSNFEHSDAVWGKGSIEFHGENKSLGRKFLITEEELNTAKIYVITLNSVNFSLIEESH